MADVPTDDERDDEDEGITEDDEREVAAAMLGGFVGCCAGVVILGFGLAFVVMCLGISVKVVGLSVRAFF